jgi:glutathione S-transferase
MKLHDLDRSPFCWKVRIVLAEKGVPYDSVPSADRQTDEAFGRLNPFRMSPVLELADGRSIYESTVICEYLEETHPQPAMLPKDAYERARVRIIEDTTDQYLYPASRQFIMSQYKWEPPHLTRKPASEIDEKAREEGRAKIEKHLAYLEDQLGDRRFFGGDMFSLADAALVPVLSAGMRLHGFLPGTKYPKLSSWIPRVLERPAVASTLPKIPLTIKD